MVSKALLQEETGVVFKNTGGNVTFTPGSTADGNGRISARGDLGAFPNSLVYRWYAETQCQATPTLGARVDIYLAWWNDAATPGDPDGDVGATDAAFNADDDLRNLKYIGSIIIDSATANVVFAASGLVEIPTRHVSAVWKNETGAALTTDNTEHGFTLYPQPFESQ